MNNPERFSAPGERRPGYAPLHAAGIRPLFRVRKQDLLASDMNNVIASPCRWRAGSALALPAA